MISKMDDKCRSLLKNSIRFRVVVSQRFKESFEIIKHQGHCEILNNSERLEKDFLQVRLSIAASMCLQAIGIPSYNSRREDALPYLQR